MYDVETGLYFLKTRYYDPTVGRFINADEVSYLDPETIGGLNLFAYCGNNPIKYWDPNGTSIILTCLLIGLIAGAIVGGAVVGGAIGAVVGAAIGVALQGLVTGITAFTSALSTFVGGGGGFALAGGGIVGGGAVVSTVTISTGAAVGIGTVVGVVGVGILFARNPQMPMNGEPNSTVTRGGSTGTYDSNGHLTSRRDTTGKAHYIKGEGLNDWYLPHTHIFEWEIVKGVWRFVKSILPY